MKKLIVGIIAIAMLVSMCGCGGGTSGSTENPSAGDTNGEVSAVQFEERSFTIATSMNANETGGKYLQHFADYITEATGGAATFSIYFGGTMGAIPEELALCSEGAVDFIALQHLPYGDALPYIGLITQYGGTLDEAIAYFNYLCFENETSSALITQEAADNNVVYVGNSMPSGANVLVSSKEFTSYDEFRSGKIIMGSPDPIFDKLGINHLSVLPPEVYESMQRGICDAYEMSLSVTVNLQWYEVAKYFAFDGSQAVACPIICNMDVWNSLSDEYKAVIKEAQDSASAYCYDLVVEGERGYVETLETNGVTFIDMPQEDLDLYAAALFESAVEGARIRAANYGIEEQMEELIAVAAEFQGMEVPAQ